MCILDHDSETAGRSARPEGFACRTFGTVRCLLGYLACLQDDRQIVIIFPSRAVRKRPEAYLTMYIMARSWRRNGLVCIKSYRTRAQHISDTARSKRSPTQSVRTSTPVTGPRACGSKQASDDSRLTVSRCRILPVRPDLLQQNVDSDATILKKGLSVHTCSQSTGPPVSLLQTCRKQIRLRLLFVTKPSPERSVLYSARGSTL